jgi:hypothetical protein
VTGNWREDEKEQKEGERVQEGNIGNRREDNME